MQKVGYFKSVGGNILKTDVLVSDIEIKIEENLTGSFSLELDMILLIKL